MSETTGTVKELKRTISTLLDENERIAQAFKIEEKGVVVTPEQAATYRGNLQKIDEMKSILDGAQSTEGLRDYLEGKTDGGSAAVAAAAALEGKGFGIYKDMPTDLGHMFTASEEFKSLQRSGGATMPSAWEVTDHDITKMGYGQKDVYAGMGGASHTTTHGFGSIQFDGTIPRNFRRARVRDLFPVARTSANLIDYFRVLGFGNDRLDLTTSASMVPDRTGNAFGLKPQSNLKFESAQAPVRTIAHWEAAHRNVLQDEPQLQSTINNELLYGVRLAEDNQILNGTGNGEDLLGILNTPGIQTYSQSAGPGTDKKQDAIRRAMTKVVLAYYDTTGLVLNPLDWEDIELDKGSDGHYSVAMNVAVGAEQRLWSVPVVDSPAIAEGTALVGAFGLGAQLYDRMQANVRIAEQHEDFFVRNAIVILAEERLALACKRPESFVKVTFS